MLKVPNPATSQRIRRTLLAPLGIAAGVAVSAILGGPAVAGDNPPPGLLAKIQIATYAPANRIAISSRAQRKPFLNRSTFRTFR